MIISDFALKRLLESPKGKYGEIPPVLKGVE